MKKILTIDFDCIMAPCIRLYNEKCFGNENPTILWKELEHRLDIDKFLCYDAKILESIAIIIQQNVKNGAKLIPIEEHHNIIKFIDMNSDEKIDLVNIDFHHDIWYSQETLNSLKMFDEFSCANWVGYLFHKNKLNSYTWAKFPTSDMFDNSGDNKVPLNVCTISDIMEMPKDFPIIVFCLSPQWVPYKYHHLYDLIVKLFGGD